VDRPYASTAARSRAINRRQQGDLGEASAIEWFSRLPATIFIPFGHSPDVDLVVELDGRLLRIQVKTSTCREPRLDGYRWNLSLATNGGNQSWSGIARVFDPSRFDLLFALVGDGRRWLIPADAIEATHGLNLGGPKYSEFEIDPGGPIEHLVYADAETKLVSTAGGVSKRTTDAGCKPVGLSPSQVRILPPPLPRRESGFKRSKYDRKLGRAGQTTINQKRKVTIPRQAVLEAGLDIGDRLRVRSHGYGRIVLERIGLYDHQTSGLAPSSP
jgi:PD-(D/E)XK endonuclease